MVRNQLMWLLGRMPNKPIEVRIGVLAFSIERVTDDGTRGVIVLDVAGGDFYEESNVSRDHGGTARPR